MCRGCRARTVDRFADPPSRTQFHRTRVPPDGRGRGRAHLRGSARARGRRDPGVARISPARGRRAGQPLRSAHMLGFRRSLALSLTAIQSIPERIGASLVTVIGVLTVMAVLVTMLALGQGLERLAQTGARPDRVSVISAGSQSSLSSSVSRSALDKVMGKPGVRHDAQGRPLVTGVVLMIIDGVTKRNQHG